MQNEDFQLTKKALTHTGFCYGDEIPPDVIFNPNLDNVDPSVRQKKYWSLFNKLDATAVFELSGSPCIYFKSFSKDSPSDDELLKLQRLAWNHGRAPLLWVITPEQIKIFNCYSVPTRGSDSSRHLVKYFDQIQKGLEELNNFSGREAIKSGSIWKTKEAKRIDRAFRVDQFLLDNLREASLRLQSLGSLSKKISHSLLGRSIFIMFLWDRRIISNDDFSKKFSMNVNDLREILINRDLTYKLFDWIRDVFNGDIFPITKKEIKDVTEDHLRIVKNFHDGMNFKTGQMRFWPYKFDIIPVELISSIYELFLHDIKDTDSNIHYTPLNLVDIVLEETFINLDASSKILDLACGSGVFLVEALRRLVSLKESFLGKLTRRDTLDTLYDHIFGIDISDEAIQIAAFSLYLTALELCPEAKSISELKFKRIVNNNLFVSDAFNDNALFNMKKPFHDNNFDAVIGNPPWSANDRTKYKYLDYCSDRNHKLSKQNIAQAFLWRAYDLSKDDASIGMLLPSRPFFSHTKGAIESKKMIIKEITPDLLINLSALREEKVFPGARSPAMIFVRNKKVLNRKQQVIFISAERSKNYRKHGIIELSPDNIKRLPRSLLIEDTDILKIASFGNSRDFQLIQKIKLSFKSLSELASSNGWKLGQGIIKGRSGKICNPDFSRMAFLPSAKLYPYYIDTNSLEPLGRRKLLASRREEIYKAPLVISYGRLFKDRFRSAIAFKDVVFTEMYFGISFSSSDLKWAHYINGIFNSSFPTYLLFLTSPTLGVERDTIKPEEVKRIPIPFLNDVSIEKIDDVIKIESDIVELSKVGGYDTELKSRLDKLDNAVYQVYGFDNNDIMLINDILNIKIPNHLRPFNSLATQRPERKDLEAYLNILFDQLNLYMFKKTNKKIVTKIYNIGNCPLQMVKIGSEDEERNDYDLNIASPIALILNNYSSYLDKISQLMLYQSKVIRIYINNCVYIIKPNELRYWCKSAALNDADELFKDHLGVKYA